MVKLKAVCLSLLALLGALAPVSGRAEEVISAYRAFIGKADLTNGKGQILRQPWQVLRQDRENFHRFGISQPGDEWDPFFGSIDNRNAMRQLVDEGKIDPAAAKVLANGGGSVAVRVFGRGSLGTSVQVTPVK